jgi:diphthine-ammonia ligase
MCGILGIDSPSAKLSTSFITFGLTQLQNRGKDAYGCASQTQILTANSLEQLQIPNQVTQNLLIAHNLHAIVGHVPQPLKIGESGGILVANCEIYNYVELAQKYAISAQNDADFLVQFCDKIYTESLDTAQFVEKLMQNLKDFNGVYACCYMRDNVLFLFRDIIGEKPLFFAQTQLNSSDNTNQNPVDQKKDFNQEHFNQEHFFAFASEQKVIRDFTKNNLSKTFVHIAELHPRKILTYNARTKEISFYNRPFFELDNSAIAKNAERDFTELKTQTLDLFLNALKLRIPDSTQKVGVLFSGGVDSTFIAFCLKKLQIPFTCYTAALDDVLNPAEDYVYAKKIATELGFELRSKIITIDEVKNYIAQVVPLIESSNVIKVGVALPFFLACEQAKEDGVRVMFSGLGSEELFAGYQRHENSSDINAECIAGLRKMYERDLYRDDVLTMHHSMELRLPFLDIPLLKFALTIPAEYKIRGETKKYILRECAKDFGLPTYYADRPKKAAQYGSKFDKAIDRLTRKQKLTLKSQYLNSFFPPQNQRLGVLFSGGKDSVFAMHTMKMQNYPITCLLTMQSENPDSYMFHTPAINLTKLSAQSLSYPLLTQQTIGEKEAELDDLRTLITRAVREYHIDGIVTGALYSVYQRERVEKIADELGLKVYSPLWHVDQEQELRQIIQSGFIVILTAVAAYGLDASWLNRPLTNADVDKLLELEKKYKINVAGEGGEFESLVLYGPGFLKRLVIDEYVIHTDGGASRMIINKAHLD